MDLHVTAGFKPECVCVGGGGGRYLTQARIQEFSSRGSTFPKILTRKKNKQKKTEREKTEEKKKQTKKNGKRENGIKKRVVVTFTDNYLHIRFFLVGHVFCTIASPSLHKYTDDMVVLIFFMCRGGGLGVLPPEKIFWLK